MMLAIVIFKICRQLMGSSPLGPHRALPLDSAPPGSVPVDNFCVGGFVRS